MTRVMLSSRKTQYMTSTEIPNRSMTREQVLALPSADKIKYFKGIIVRHPHMVSALEDVLTLATPDCGSDIIFLIGPSGVGKSETFKTAEQNIILDCKGELESDPSFIPVIVVEAQETGETGFSWRVFYSDI